MFSSYVFFAYVLVVVIGIIKEKWGGKPILIVSLIKVVKVWKVLKNMKLDIITQNNMYHHHDSLFNLLDFCKILFLLKFKKL